MPWRESKRISAIEVCSINYSYGKFILIHEMLVSRESVLNSSKSISMDKYFFLNVICAWYKVQWLCSYSSILMIFLSAEVEMPSFLNTKLDIFVYYLIIKLKTFWNNIVPVSNLSDEISKLANAWSIPWLEASR